MKMHSTSWYYAYCVVRQQHLVVRQEILRMRQAVTDLFDVLRDQRDHDEDHLHFQYCDLSQSDV